MKTKVLMFLAGLVAGVLLMLLAGQRYDLQISEQRPIAYRLDRLTGETVSYSFNSIRQD